MSKFYGDLQGSRGEATRCGTKQSGIRSHVRGWHVGIRATVDDRLAGDTVHVYATSGSSNNGTSYDGFLIAYTAGQVIEVSPLLRRMIADYDKAQRRAKRDAERDRPEVERIIAAAQQS